MRRGVVLFITLMILLMLSTIIMLFLKESSQIKKSVRKNIATIQTNIILSDMSKFLKNQKFSQEDIFYGSDIPVALDLGPILGTISLTSAQSRININLFLESVLHDQQALISFLDWLDRLKLKNQPLLLSLLLDSYDKDKQERMSGSEIILQKPWFKNGSIADFETLKSILQTYSELSGDKNVSLQKWERVFGFEGDRIDLNYANSDQIRLLFPDIPQIAQEALARHDMLYKSVDDIPVDTEIKQKLTQKRFGIQPVFKTLKAKASIEFTTTQECRGDMSFLIDLGKKKILDISVHRLLCL